MTFPPFVVFIFPANKKPARSSPCASNNIVASFSAYNIYVCICRYGEVFKSHILGCPCVMIANPQGVKFVLSQAHLFKPTFPPSKQRMIGPHAIFFHDGPYHAKLRKLVLASFLPDSIRHVVPAIEQLSIATLESWVDDNQGDRLHGAKIINTFMEMKKVYTCVCMYLCLYVCM